MPVLADQLAEDPATPYLRCREIGGGNWSDLASVRREQDPGPMRAMLVVMHNVLIQNRAQVPCPGNQHPVRELGPNCPHPAFSKSIRPQAARRDLHHLDPRALKYRVECFRELYGPRSRIRNRNRAALFPRSIRRFRACCTVHAPSGWAVTPRTCT
jgi:hypothetical protein